MKKIFIGILVLIFFPIAYYFLHLHVLQMSESYVEKKKNTLQKEFYDKLNEYWAGESRLMYSEEYGSTSYVPMDMDAVQFIDNRKMCIRDRSISESSRFIFYISNKKT